MSDSQQPRRLSTFPQAGLRQLESWRQGSGRMNQADTGSVMKEDTGRGLCTGGAALVGSTLYTE